MMKINSLFVIATAQLLPENEVPKFSGAKVSFLANLSKLYEGSQANVMHQLSDIRVSLVCNGYSVTTIYFIHVLFFLSDCR